MPDKKPAEAVELAIDQCIEENILKEYLLKKKSEVKRMLLTEFDEELFARTMKEEGLEEGIEKGLEKGRKEGLEQGIELLIKNALTSTHNITQTAHLLMVPEEKVEKVAREYKIPTKEN